MPKGKRTRKKGRKTIRIFPDSNFLISYLFLKDAHHKHATSCFNLLTPYEPNVYLSTLVMMETMNGLIRKAGMTPSEAYKTLTKFRKNLSHPFTERPIKLDKVLQKFLDFARAKKIKKLSTNDFYIVTEAILVGAKLLTTDKRMYKTAKKSYGGSYLVTDKVKGLKSDLPRLCRDIVYNLE